MRGSSENGAGLPARPRASCAGAALTALLMVLAAVLVPGGRPLAVSVFDLIHDTPAVRKRYRMDILGFTTEDAPGHAGGDSPESAQTLWLAREQYQELGEIEKADAQIESLIAWRVAHGRDNLVPFAFLLIREAFENAREGKRDRAEALLAFAARMAPDYPPVYLAAGHLALGSPLGLPAFVQGWFRSVKAILREAYHLSVLLGRLSISAVLVVLVSVLAWAAALMARYGVHLRHDLREYLFGGRKIRMQRKWVVVLLAVLAPAILFSSPLWLLPVAIFISWSYQGVKERIVSLVSLLLLAAIPLLLWLASSTLTFLGDDINTTIISFRNGSESAGQATLLEEGLKERPKDAALLFSMAQHTWRTGRYQESEEFLRRVIGADGSLKVQALVNIGNTLAARGDLDGAAAAYREALALNDESAPAHYNLGQVLNLQFNFSEGGRQMERALEIDKTLISRAPTADQDVLKTFLSENLPVSVILRRIFTSGDLMTLSNRGVNLWDLSLTGVTGISYMAGIVVIAFLGPTLAGMMAKRGLSRRCSRCGRAFCALCVPGAAKVTVCPQCQHIFVVKEGVESAMRVEKMMEVKSYRTRRRVLGVVLSALLPGSGQAFLGSPLMGMLLALVSAVAMVAAAGVSGPFIDRHWLVLPWHGSSVVAGLFAVLVVYSVNLITVFRMMGKER